MRSELRLIVGGRRFVVENDVGRLFIASRHSLANQQIWMFTAANIRLLPPTQPPRLYCVYRVAAVNPDKSKRDLRLPCSAFLCLFVYIWEALPLLSKIQSNNLIYLLRFLMKLAMGNWRPKRGPRPCFWPWRGW